MEMNKIGDSTIKHPKEQIKSKIRLHMFLLLPFQ